MNILDILYIRRNENLLAIKQGQREITYKDLWNRIVTLSKVDVGNNENIGIYIDNSIEFIVALFSILYTGKVATLIDVSSKAEDVFDVIEKCNIRTVWSVSKFAKELNKLDKKKINVHFADEIENYELKENEYFSEMILDRSDDVAVIIPTSGTTSERKYVQLTHKNIYTNFMAVNRLYRLKEGERNLLSLPLTSMFCLTVDLLVSFSAGMCVVIYEGTFSPKIFLRQLYSDKIDYFITVPAVLKALCALKDREYFKVDKIRRVTIGGEKASLSELNEFYDAFKNAVVIYGYGMTECSPVLTTTTLDDYREKNASVGKAIEDVKIKIVDSEGNIIKNNEIGEIIASGPNIMKGYYGKSDSNIVDGWIKTGDLGYLDDDGYLYVTGRIKNLIISAGKNVSPEEVETTLLNSSLVSDIRVRGIKNDVFGEMVVADIVLSNGVTVEAVKNYCIDHIASYKIPKKFYVCEKIEKNSMNKIVRKV
ncbi:MAG: acyl--CoA ligase [Eubacterium sp.]|nr:acyl--CoA ligase [Eubacterium sp.]